MAAVNAFVASRSLYPDSPVGWLALGVVVALVVFLVVEWRRK